MGQQRLQIVLILVRIYLPLQQQLKQLLIQEIRLSKQQLISLMHWLQSKLQVLIKNYLLRINQRLPQLWPTLIVQQQLQVLMQTQCHKPKLS